jgi:hypothetical protein
LLGSGCALQIIALGRREGARRQVNEPANLPRGLMQFSVPRAAAELDFGVCRRTKRDP